MNKKTSPSRYEFYLFDENESININVLNDNALSPSI